MNLHSFITEMSSSDLPAAVQHQARRCLLDTLGAAIGGRQTPLSQIIHDHVSAVYGGNLAELWFDGRRVSSPGAALANGMTIDALDIHDGYHMNKGHIGAAIVPSIFATLGFDPSGKASGRELLTTLVVGYEIAARAGRALHSTACDYHASGAWSALGCAAVTARRLQLDHERTREALGIAEYHGPRSQMMRCVDHPTMVKDGSGWGAMAGISAALMAANGFTGAPAITVESDEVREIWADVGQRWLILEQYFKRYGVCYWAQPSITGVRELREEHAIPMEDIAQIRLYTFHEATRLSCRHPRSTEEAQYSLPFPVAAALVHGRLGPAELSGESLDDPTIVSLAESIEMMEDPEFNAHFPSRRFARVEITTSDGRVYTSGNCEADWLPDNPPTDDELLDKFRWLARTALTDVRAKKIEKTVWDLAEMSDAAGLVHLLSSPSKRAKR